MLEPYIWIWGGTSGDAKTVDNKIKTHFSNEFFTSSFCKKHAKKSGKIIEDISVEDKRYCFVKNRGGRDYHEDNTVDIHGTQFKHKLRE